jgi:hypothetical protein
VDKDIVRVGQWLSGLHEVEGSSDSLVLTLKCGHPVCASIETPDTRPLRRFEIRGIRLDPLGKVRVGLPDIDLSVRPKHDGVCILDVPSGEWELVVTAWDYIRSEPVRVVGGQDKVVQFRLRVPCEVSGRVCNLQGEGIAGKHVYVLPQDSLRWFGEDRSKFAISDIDGKFRMSRLPPGIATVYVGDDTERDSDEITVRLQPGIPLDCGTLVVER